MVYREGNLSTNTPQRPGYGGSCRCVHTDREKRLMALIALFGVRIASAVLSFQTSIQIYAQVSAGGFSDLKDTLGCGAGLNCITGPEDSTGKALRLLLHRLGTGNLSLTVLLSNHDIQPSQVLSGALCISDSLWCNFSRLVDTLPRRCGPS